MKIYTKLFVLIIVLGLFTLSCKKDDETEKVEYVPAYYTEIDGNRVIMDTCYDIYSKDYSDDYYHNYLLVEKTVYYNDHMSSLLGKGSGFKMSFESNSNDLIAEGEYIFDPTATQPIPKRIVDANYYINYDYFMGEGDMIKMLSGKCVITKTAAADGYKLEGSFTGKNGKEYKIYYNSTITQEYSDHSF